MSTSIVGSVSAGGNALATMDFADPYNVGDVFVMLIVDYDVSAATLTVAPDALNGAWSLIDSIKDNTNSFRLSAYFITATTNVADMIGAVTQSGGGHIEILCYVARSTGAYQTAEWTNHGTTHGSVDAGTFTFGENAVVLNLVGGHDSQGVADPTIEAGAGFSEDSGDARNGTGVKWFSRQGTNSTHALFSFTPTTTGDPWYDIAIGVGNGAAGSATSQGGGGGSGGGIIGGGVKTLIGD